MSCLCPAAPGSSVFFTNNPFPLPQVLPRLLPSSGGAPDQPREYRTRSPVVPHAPRPTQPSGLGSWLELESPGLTLLLGFPKFPKSTQNHFSCLPAGLEEASGSGACGVNFQGHCCVVRSAAKPGYLPPYLGAQLGGPLGNEHVREGGPRGPGRGHKVPGLEAGPELVPRMPREPQLPGAAWESDAQSVPWLGSAHPAGEIVSDRHEAT